MVTLTLALVGFIAGIIGGSAVVFWVCRESILVKDEYAISPTGDLYSNCVVGTTGMTCVCVRTNDTYTLDFITGNLEPRKYFSTLRDQHIHKWRLPKSVAEQVPARYMTIELIEKDCL